MKDIPETINQNDMRKGTICEYNLIDALRKNPTWINAGADICAVAADEITRLRTELAEKYGDEEKPRYTTKRLRYELAQDRKAALEDAAQIADAVARNNAPGRNEQSQACHIVSSEIAATIRKLKREPKP